MKTSNQSNHVDYLREKVTIYKFVYITFACTRINAQYDLLIFARLFRKSLQPFLTWYVKSRQLISISNFNQIINDSNYYDYNIIINASRDSCLTKIFANVRLVH